MKQVHLKLLLCLLLAVNATCQYKAGHPYYEPYLTSGQPAAAGYGAYPAFSHFKSFAPLSIPSSSSESQGAPSQQLPTPLWVPSSSNQQLAEPINKQQAAATVKSPLPVSSERVLQHDNVYGPPSYTDSQYVNPYAEPSGPPFGFQSTGKMFTYKTEKIDLSKCGPALTTNPCVKYNQQYYPLTGYPKCYVQCVFGRAFVKPCPADLVWNSRINVCDWPTIAPPDSFDDSAMLLPDYNANYALARKKRSTVERKKRSFYSLHPYHQALYMQHMARSQQSSQPAPVQYQPAQPRIPVTSYTLPGPVSFGGQFGFAGIPSQYMPGYVPPTTTPPTTTAAPPVAAPPTPPVARIQTAPPPPPPTPAFAPIPRIVHAPMPASPLPVAMPAPYIQTRNLPPYSPGLYADAPPPASAAVPAINPMTPTANVAPVQVPTVYNPMHLFVPPVPVSVQTSSVVQQPPIQPASPTNFITPTPVAMTATLIPGPFYPNGPPYGGPFGRRPPPRPRTPPSKPALPAKPTPTEAKPTEDATQSKYVKIMPIGMFDPSGRLFFPDLASSANQLPITSRSAGGQTFPNMMGLDRQYFPSMSPMNAQYQGLPFALGRDTGSGLDLVLFPMEDESAEEGYENAADSSKTDDKKNAKETPVEPAAKPAPESDYEDEDDADDTEQSGELEEDGNNKIFGDYSAENSDEDDDYPYMFRQKRQVGSTFGEARNVAAREPKPPARYVPATNDLSKSVRPPFAPTSPCAGKRPRTNIAHPTDDTLFITCLHQQYYVIMQCPNSLVYNARTIRCEKRQELQSICEHERPCLNQGQCYTVNATAYICNCPSAWTGKQCEIPMSSCARNPCGPNNECQTLKTSDYQQDYICICNQGQSYGLSCTQNTILNPCLSATSSYEQYHPFAWSKQAFIQCNGDLLYIQPCPPGLYWNKNEKVCDHIGLIEAEDQSQPRNIVHSGNEHQSKLVRPISNFITSQGDQDRLKQNKQSETMLIDPHPPSVNKIIPNLQESSQLSSRSIPLNHHMMAHEQPILTHSRQALASSRPLSIHPPQPEYTRPHSQEQPPIYLCVPSSRPEFNKIFN